MKAFLVALLVCIPLTACDRESPNTDPKAGVVWTVPNKTTWKQCDGSTMLYGQANRGAPQGRWVTATQPNAEDCK